MHQFVDLLYIPFSRSLNIEGVLIHEKQKTLVFYISSDCNISNIKFGLCKG